MISLETKDWIIKDFDTVLFDKDGTFIDLHYFWGKMTEMRAQEVISKFQIDSSYYNQICLFLGYSINEQKMLANGITALYSRTKIIELFTKNLLELGVDTNEEMITKIFDDVSRKFYNDIDKYTKPIKTAIDFIKELKTIGLKIGIVTSDSIESTEYNIKTLKLNNIFDIVVGRESSEQTKESGALTNIALKSLKSAPTKTIMIGDAPMDYLSAKNAGIERTILVATGQIGKQDLEKYSNYTANSLSEIVITKI